MTEIGLKTPFGYVAILPSTFLALQAVVLVLAGAVGIWAAVHGQTVQLGLSASIIVLVTMFGLSTSVEIKEGDDSV